MEHCTGKMNLKQCLTFLETEQFHDNLDGYNFLVYTDNKPLTHVLSSAKLDDSDHRCLAYLGYYDFSTYVQKCEVKQRC